MAPRYTARMSNPTPAAPTRPFVSVGSKYRDVLDFDRTVVPQNAEGVCRVFFGRQYVGKTTIPVKLFDPSKCDVARYGFLPVPE